LATEVSYSKLSDVTNNWPTTYAHEVKYLIQRNYKPLNLTIAEWESAKQVINQVFQ